MVFSERYIRKVIMCFTRGLMQMFLLIFQTLAMFFARFLSSRHRHHASLLLPVILVAAGSSLPFARVIAAGGSYILLAGQSPAPLTCKDKRAEVELGYSRAELERSLSSLKLGSFTFRKARFLFSTNKALSFSTLLPKVLA